MENENSKKPKKPRLSIGKKHSESGVVAELLMLLETVTADGTVSDEEARALNQWLEENKSDLDLPGVEFLLTTVRSILADGKVTPDEKTALYKAVEMVLPPEARRKAKERRQAVEGLDKERHRAEKETEKEQRRLERERDRCVGRANFMVAGVTFEGRAALVHEFVSVGDTVFLARDPNNKYDKRAVQIRLKNGYQIGFVPREDAGNLAPLLDKGCVHAAEVTKILQGKRAPIPVVRACLYAPGSQVEGAVSQAQLPVAKQHGKGCFGFTLVLAGLFGLSLLAVTSLALNQSVHPGPKKGTSLRRGQAVFSNPPHSRVEKSESIGGLCGYPCRYRESTERYYVTVLKPNVCLRQSVALPAWSIAPGSRMPEKPRSSISSPLRLPVSPPGRGRGNL